MKDQVFDPASAARIGVGVIEERIKNKNSVITLPFPVLGQYVRPIYPGNMVTITGQQHHGKSAVMDAIEFHLGNQVINKKEPKILVHIDTETTIQQLASDAIAMMAQDLRIPDIARGNVTPQEMNEILRASEVYQRLPIYRIAEDAGSLAESPLHLSNVEKALMALATGQVDGRKYQIYSIFLDYLQAIPRDPGAQKEKNLDARRERVRDDAFRIRALGTRFGCPTFVASQAKQILADAPGPNMLIPGQYDDQESSAIAQRADVRLAVWMPKQTHPVGARLKHGSIEFTVKENGMWIRCQKQRGRGFPSGRAWYGEWHWENYSFHIEERFG